MAARVVDLDLAGGTGSVQVDGDLVHGVRDVTVIAEAGRVPTVTLAIASAVTKVHLDRAEVAFRVHLKGGPWGPWTGEGPTLRAAVEAVLRQMPEDIEPTEEAEL